MDYLDTKPHPYTKPRTGELFICFTARQLSHQSSSIRLTNKSSILSPARGDSNSNGAATATLSASLSRRLRASGSVKGGKSPMFLAGNKKKGSGFENPEPSSPKVTCIGQVRVKTKKQSKKMKMMRNCRSRRHGGEMSFRRGEREGLSHQNSQSTPPDCLPHRNQRWVHLPLTICEALRAFGAEINCFSPCKSSPCVTHCDSEREKVDSRRGSVDTNDGSCCRWFVSLGKGNRGDIELVVGGNEEVEDRRRVAMERGGMASRRRSIFDGIEFEDEIGSGDGEERRVSICIPPKNALLLMRCRSDLVRMAALSNKDWEPAMAMDVEDDEDYEEEFASKHDVLSESDDGLAKQGGDQTDGISGEGSSFVEEQIEEVGNLAPEEELHEKDEDEKSELDECRDSYLEEDTEDEDVKIVRLMEAEVLLVVCPNNIFPRNSGNREDHVHEYEVDISNSVEEIKDQDAENNESSPRSIQQEHEEEPDPIHVLETGSISDQEACHEAIESEHNPSQNEEQENRETETEIVLQQCQTAHEPEVSEKPRSYQASLSDFMTQEQDQEQFKPKKHQQEPEREPTELPDCLLLMMCEPKLSTEVSKETWVGSADFLRWLPDRHHRRKIKPTNNSSHETKKTKVIKETAKQPPQSMTLQQVLLQPPRSSCSFPIVPSNGRMAMASMIEQKLANAEQKLASAIGGYEPFVLPRCKSEPVRSTGKLTVPELVCFWNNRKLESHRPATVGAAGVGF
ncbi:hypothetical protein Droror1_Dr00014172 [Drosera rotundifolia]